MMWCALLAAGLPASPPFHPPAWAVTLDTEWAPTALATNDFAAYAVVNNSVTAYDGFTGSTRWVNNVSGVFAVVQVSANNKWVVVQTGTDFFVFDASSGVLASQSQNYSDITDDVPNVVATQFDDVFIGIDNSWSAFIAEVNHLGVLETVWTSNMTNVKTLSPVPGTPYMYFLQSEFSLSGATLQVVDIQSREVLCTRLVIAVSTTPVNGHLAVIGFEGSAHVLDLTNGCAVLWNNTLGGIFVNINTIIQVIQTAGSVIVTASYNAANPLFVLDAESGAVLGNYTADQGYQLLASTVAAGRLVALVLNISMSDTTPLLIAMDPSSGEVLSSCIVPTLAAPNYVVMSIGGGNVVVPNSQGFATFRAVDVSVPLSYNLDSPGATSVAVFTSKDSSMFLLVDGTTFTGFASVY
jgi:hypothetical protein